MSKTEYVIFGARVIVLQQIACGRTFELQCAITHAETSRQGPHARRFEALRAKQMRKMIRRDIARYCAREARV